MDQPLKSIEHYRIVYKQNYRGIHNIHQLQIFYGDVLWAVIDARKKYGWKFWKWTPYLELVERIEREHRKCCSINL